MTAAERPCPGCGVDRGPDICCDPCWERLPLKLPIGPGGELMTWRRRLPRLRMVRDWSGIDRIQAVIRQWLREHPARVDA